MKYIIILFFSCAIYIQAQNIREQYYDNLYSDRAKAEQIIKQLQNSDDNSDRVFGIIAEAHMYSQYNELDNSEKVYNEIDTTSLFAGGNELNDEKLYYYLYRSTLEFQKHNYPKSNQLLYKGLDLSSKSNNSTFMRKFRMSLARNLNFIQDYNGSNKIIYQLLKEKNDIDTINIKFIYILKSANYYDLYQKSNNKFYLDSMKAGIDDLESYFSNNSTYFPNYLSQKAKYFGALKVYDSAQKYYNLKLEYVNDNPTEIFKIYNELGWMYLIKSEIPLSVKYFKKGENLFYENELRDSIDLVSLYMGLSLCYDYENNDDSAYFYLKNFNVLNNKYKEEMVEFSNSLNSYEKNYYDNEINSLNEKQQKSTFNWYVVSGVLIALIICITLYYSYRERQLNEKFRNIQENYANSGKQNKTANPKTQLLEDSKILDFEKQLQKLEEENFYLDPEINLYKLAKELNTNTSYLSKYFNEDLNSSFNQYLSDKRYEYLINRLNTDNLFRRYNTSSIAQEIGYTNPNSFTRWFKGLTGITPTNYIKKLESSNV